GSVGERLAILVNNLVTPGATDVKLRYKQKDLCALLGTQRTTLIATLDRFSEEGILEYDSNELKLLDQEKLMVLSGY
ncbi:MAG: winged helix-turn-helix domain-containing protein, partial [Muribaculaceae bacterium]|nr:winged helix-turn-helix domain-containing protein [Muribaculaceae bacterium]